MSNSSSWCNLQWNMFTPSGRGLEHFLFTILSELFSGSGFQYPGASCESEGGLRASLRGCDELEPAAVGAAAIPTVRAPLLQSARSFARHREISSSSLNHMTSAFCKPQN